MFNFDSFSKTAEYLFFIQIRRGQKNNLIEMINSDIIIQLRSEEIWQQHFLLIPTQNQKQKQIK